MGLAFLSVSVIILNQGLGPKLGPDSLMETPGFRAGLQLHREGLRTGSGVACVGVRAGFPPSDTFYAEGAFLSLPPTSHGPPHTGTGGLNPDAGLQATHTAAA